MSTWMQGIKHLISSNSLTTTNYLFLWGSAAVPSRSGGSRRIDRAG
nr:hypothetical protein [uncultured bacterium]